MTSDACVNAFKTFNINMLHWNINGVKNKFSSEFVKKLIADVDILVISETHFNIRIKCPEKFYLIGKSKPKQKEKARGGIAMYRSFTCNVRLEMIDIGFDDCVIAEVCDSNVIIAAMYIPPNNSKYYDKEYFINLQSFLETYSGYRDVIIIGDLNARAPDTSDTLNHPNHTYRPNPDTGANQNGKLLKNIISKYDNVFLVNGLNINGKQFCNKMTFYRGRQASRNDLCFSNNTQLITNFDILPKCVLSDHCPVKISMKVDIDLWMTMLPECVAGINNYTHYDKSRKIQPKIKVSRCNIPLMIENFTKLGELLNNKYIDTPSDQKSVDTMCNEITHKMYETIKKSKRINEDKLPEPTQKNCTSKNFYAIAEIHAYQYQQLRHKEPEKAIYYHDQWCYYLEIAIRTEEKEITNEKEKSWRNLYKNDSRKLWKLIAWKEKDHDEKKAIPPKVIHHFFTNIFQSPLLTHVPKIESIKDNTVYKNTQQQAILWIPISLQKKWIKQ